MTASAEWWKAVSLAFVLGTIARMIIFGSP
jgi:hypothetical protein